VDGSPPRAIDCGVLPPPRDDIPRYAPKPRPPRLQGQQQDAEQPVAAANVAFDGKARKRSLEEGRGLTAAGAGPRKNSLGATRPV
jgi:hypothetical protein